MNQTPPPVIKELATTLSREASFRLFTEHFGEWWPRHTHSVGLTETAAVVFEAREGGRVFERQRSGAEHLWGIIKDWNPPENFSMSWHPGRDVSTAQHLEVRFVAEADRTRIVLSHSGWERAPAERDAYDNGWVAVLARFADAAASR